MHVGVPITWDAVMDLSIQLKPLGTQSTSNYATCATDSSLIAECTYEGMILCCLVQHTEALLKSIFQVCGLISPHLANHMSRRMPRETGAGQAGIRVDPRTSQISPTRWLHRPAWRDALARLYIDMSMQRSRAQELISRHHATASCADASISLKPDVAHRTSQICKQGGGNLSVSSSGSGIHTLNCKHVSEVQTFSLSHQGAKARWSHAGQNTRGLTALHVARTPFDVQILLVLDVAKPWMHWYWCDSDG